MSSKENTLREMVGHERRQDLIGVLASLPDAIGGALQRLSVRQYSVCSMSAAYNKYTAVIETELLPAEKRAQKERSKFRVKARETGDCTPTVGERVRRRREQFEGKWAGQRAFIVSNGSNGDRIPSAPTTSKVYGLSCRVSTS
jgi:hypothetical protein